jgi:predicted transcriptional regulator
VPLTGDQWLTTLSALANPHRLRILGVLTAHGRNFVSQLARDVGLSRPLLNLHLRKLEEAGLVVSALELSADGKARNFFEVAPFALSLTPEVIAAALNSLTIVPSRPET